MHLDQAFGQLVAQWRVVCGKLAYRLTLNIGII